MGNQTKKRKMPGAFAILLLLIILVAVLTWLLPAGQYARMPDGEPIAGTYETVERNGQTVWDVCRAPLEGLYEAMEVAVFILTVGGFLGVLGKTGAIDAGIAAIVRALGSRGGILIPVLMSVFALGGTTFGMAEETIAFYPLLLPVMVAAGYDALTGVSVILLGAGAGVLGSTVNPFATGIASGFAGVGLGEGIGLRLALLGLSLGISVAVVLIYGSRVRKDPRHSMVYAHMEAHRAHFAVKAGDNTRLKPRQKLALWIFGGTFLVMIYGVIPFDEMGITAIPTLGWWFPELSALFLTAALAAGLLCRLGETETVDGFVSGAAELLGVAFIIGLSRGITVLMDRGMLTDTVLHWGEVGLTGAGPVGFTLLTFLLLTVLSFLIPSSSGLATLSMPILAPLAEMAGVSRALVVTAFQTASGLVNLITPTSAVVMGALAIGRVSYGTWLRFVLLPLLLMLGAGLVLLTLGALGA